MTMSEKMLGRCLFCDIDLDAMKREGKIGHVCSMKPEGHADGSYYSSETDRDDCDALRAAQEERAARQGKHTITCSGYNERPCDCGLVDGILAALAEALDAWERHDAAQQQAPSVMERVDIGRGDWTVRARPRPESQAARIAELRAKHLGTKP